MRHGSDVLLHGHLGEGMLLIISGNGGGGVGVARTQVAPDEDAPDVLNMNYNLNVSLYQNILRTHL